MKHRNKTIFAGLLLLTMFAGTAFSAQTGTQNSTAAKKPDLQSFSN